ncbi:MAG TPA: Cys-tRNA(Pro) deacylase [Propionicimonas sp.]|nr:Cys-tRNA(Pro) deacylase [Propionicimonas sp.]
MAATPATIALDAAAVRYRLHSYHHDPAATSFGQEAATALGIDPLRMFKTLVVELSATPLRLAVAMVPVAGTLNLKACGQAFGVKRVSMAQPTHVTRSTGYVLGGVSPLGQRSTLPTVIDETCQLWDTIFVSAGRRGLDVELDPADLIRVTAAQVADIAT